MAAVTSLMRVQQLVLARVDGALRPLGLTFARYEVLMLLSFSRRGSLSIGGMGGRLQVHPTSVTNAVDRLEAAGLVQRRPHPQDRRRTLVALTEGGRGAAEKATEVLNREVFGALGLSAERTAELVGVLTDYRRAAGDLPA